MYRTLFVNSDDLNREWFVVDAANMPIGRLAARVAAILRGKHKPSFAPHQDNGDFVIIVNADKVRLTGTKGGENIYWHTQWPGGLRTATRGEWLENKPVKLVEKVVWGMLPKTKLGRRMVKKLKVYAGPNHPHTAQNPKSITVE